MTETPPPPKELTGVALERWMKVAPYLASRGSVDVVKLTTYCQVWARWRQAEEGLSKSSPLVQKRGGLGSNPLIQISNQAQRQVAALEKSLRLEGLEDTPTKTPSEDDQTLTRRALAAAFGVHMMTVTKWEQDGMPVAERGRKGKPSRYRAEDVRAWIEAREEAASKTGLVDVAQERARKENAQARLAEQTYQVRARTLLPAEEVSRLWSAEVTAVRSVILSSYTTHADRVFRAATVDGLAGVELALKELAYEILRELADPHRDIKQAS